MTLGKVRPKLAMSWSSRRLRLGVAHSGTPSSYLAPVKDPAPTTPTPLREQPRKNRR